tara:strand:+ start:126 stop:800 length:675 start_codon:yes stop_codon:yes gene_type:complete
MSQTASEYLHDQYFNELLRLNTWATEITAANISFAAIVCVIGLTCIIFFASRVLSLSGTGSYAKMNAKHLIGASICFTLSMAEIYLLVTITKYVPTGYTMPKYYLDLDLQRLDCLLSDKGGKKAGFWGDCRYGQGPLCSLTEPCTPCDVNEFMSDDVKERVRNFFPSKCKICTRDINNVTLSSCKTFQEGIGPYCYYRGLKRVLELRPCKMCCVEVNTSVVAPF